jgi:hypothetical protein
MLPLPADALRVSPGDLNASNAASPFKYQIFVTYKRMSLRAHRRACATCER